MSSSMRWRSGLMGFSLIGGSCLEVGVLQPLDPQDGAPARHQRSINALAVLLTVSIPATFSRGSGFVRWPWSEMTKVQARQHVVKQSKNAGVAGTYARFRSTPDFAPRGSHDQRRRSADQIARSSGRQWLDCAGT